MEMDIAKLEFDFMGTSVICRSGSPLILADLKKVETKEFSFGCSCSIRCFDNFISIAYLCFFWQVSVSKARAIIVLASDENADQVSSFVLCSFNICRAHIVICHIIPYAHILCPLERCTSFTSGAESDWSQGGSKRPYCCRDE